MIDEKELELSERKIGTREPSASCVVFDIDSIDKTFRDSAAIIENTLKNGRKLETEGKKDFAYDVYRFIVSSLESVFDYFLHCVIKLGFKEIFLEEREKTERFKKFMIPMDVVTKLISDTANPQPLLDYVNQKTAFETFLPYKAFKENMALIDENLLKAVSNELYPDNPKNGLQKFIDDIYIRRNLIVHQDDRAHSTGVKKDISYAEVCKYKDSLFKVIECMIKHLKKGTSVIEGN